MITRITKKLIELSKTKYYCSYHYLTSFYPQSKILKY